MEHQYCYHCKETIVVSMNPKYICTRCRLRMERFKLINNLKILSKLN